MSPLKLVKDRRGHLLTGALVIVLLALFLAGCETDTPQNTFDARGEVARQQRDLFYLAMWPAIVIMFFVLGGLVVTLLRFRRRSPDEVPKQTHGNTKLEIAWTLAPTALLIGLGVPMVALIFDLGRPPSDDAFRVNVTGVQWQWLFEYPDLLDENGEPVGTIRELHVPAGREVALTITSEDVIHSFWVPKLGGKLDAVPGKENVMWLRADEPGSFSGQCAEFCGLGHAEMRLVLIAHDQEDFQAWADEVTGGNQGD